MLYDLFGSSISLLSTYFFIKINSKAWLVGLIATCFNGCLYWYKGIYANTGLEIFYFASTCYGWYQWSSLAPKSNVIKSLSNRQWLYLIFILVAIYGLIYKILTISLNSNIANLDALTSAISIIAQCLMCQKIMSTWVLWFVADLLYTWIYLGKELFFHALLMLLYTAMAISGYIRWRYHAKACSMLI